MTKESSKEPGVSRASCAIDQGLLTHIISVLLEQGEVISIGTSGRSVVVVTKNGMIRVKQRSLKGTLNFLDFSKQKAGN